MRLIVCNKYFFLNGGTERYLRNCLDTLPKYGVETIPFSVAYDGSWPSEYAQYFLPPPGNPDEAHFNNIRVTPGKILPLIERSVYSFQAKRYLNRLLDHVGGANVGYILNTYNYMSLSLTRAFHARGIPVVVRFGDYNALCANYTLLRNGRPCTECVSGNYLHGLAHRCVKGSLAATLVRTIALYVQKWLRLYYDADAVIAPCDFMRRMLVQGGFDAKRIHVIRQPAAPPAEIPTVEKENYILYFGRLSEEKGLDTLIRAYQRLRPGPDLLLVGRSYDGCRERLQRLILPDLAHKIRFVDFLEGETLARTIAAARICVVPSRWFDNAPLSIYESYYLATPVLAANIGGIPEQVRPGITGDLFAADDADDLAGRLANLLARPDDLLRMGQAAREFAHSELGLDKHMTQLVELLEHVADANRLV